MTSTGRCSPEDMPATYRYRRNVPYGDWSRKATFYASPPAGPSAWPCPICRSSAFRTCVDGRLLGIEPLCKEDVCALIRECDEKGIAWGVQIDNSDTRLVPDERFFKETRDGYLKNRVVPGLDPEKLEKIYKAYIVCPEPEEQKLEALKKLPWCRYMPEYFFVEPLEKAKGIRRMMDHLGAPHVYGRLDQGRHGQRNAAPEGKG